MNDTLEKVKVTVMTVLASNDLISGDKTLIVQLVLDACHF